MNKTEFIAAVKPVIAASIAFVAIIAAFATGSYVSHADAAEPTAAELPVALTARESECVEALSKCVGVTESGETFPIFSDAYIAALTAVVETRNLDLASTNNAVRSLDGYGKCADDLVVEILQKLGENGTGAWEKEVASNVLANL